MLIEQSSGGLYAVSADHEVFTRELAAAKQAVNGEVVAEASTLALITMPPERAPVLLSAFTTVRLPRPALVDLETAWSDLTRDPGSWYSISYDPERDVLVSRTLSLPEHQRLYRRITEIDQLARTLTITDLTETPPSPDAHQPWLAAVDLSAQQRLPLWSDDIAIRSIAASKGVTTFGTWALLSVLIEAGLIPDTSQEDALVLAAEGVINLAMASDEASA